MKWLLIPRPPWPGAPLLLPTTSRTAGMVRRDHPAPARETREQSAKEVRPAAQAQCRADRCLRTPPFDSARGHRARLGPCLCRLAVRRMATLLEVEARVRGPR